METAEKRDFPELYDNTFDCKVCGNNFSTELECEPDTCEHCCGYDEDQI